MTWPGFSGAWQLRPVVFRGPPVPDPPLPDPLSGEGLLTSVLHRPPPCTPLMPCASS